MGAQVWTCWGSLLLNLSHVRVGSSRLPHEKHCSGPFSMGPTEMKHSSIYWKETGTWQHAGDLLGAGVLGLMTGGGVLGLMTGRLVGLGLLVGFGRLLRGVSVGRRLDEDGFCWLTWPNWAKAKISSRDKSSLLPLTSLLPGGDAT